LNSFKRFYLNNCRKYFFKEDTFEMVLKACQYQYLIDGTKSIWCKFFDEEMLKTLEYQEDIKYNCKYGYKHNISRDMACDLLKHLTTSLDQFKNS
jgi:hypothetical protein